VKRILFDVNVILDVLLDSRPFAAAASSVWGEVEQGRARGLLPAHAVTTIHYLNARAVGARLARETTDALLSVFDVAPVDAVTAAAARRARCDVIVTRNPRDFKASPVRVLTPAEAAAWLGVVE
jgi:predicted nucleic acid-binding protein